MHRISEVLNAIKEDRRADHLLDTKAAAEATGMHARKFGSWWDRNREKLICLAMIQPGELAAEFAMIFAESEVRRSQLLNKTSATPTARPPRP